MAKKNEDTAKGTVTVFSIADPNSVEDTYADMVFTHAPMTRQEVYGAICRAVEAAGHDEWEMSVSDVEDHFFAKEGLTVHSTPHPWIKVEGDEEIDNTAKVKP